MGDYIIELKNISKCYEGDTAAVDNVSLSIAKGEFVTLLDLSCRRPVRYCWAVRISVNCHPMSVRSTPYFRNMRYFLI